MDRIFITFHAQLFYRLDKSLNRKGIVLGGNAEFFFFLFLDIPALQKPELFRYLSRIPQKLLALRRKADPPVRSQKNFNPGLRLQLFHSLRQTWLGNKKLFCRFIHRTTVCDCQGILQLLQSQFSLPSCSEILICQSISSPFYKILSISTGSYRLNILSFPQTCFVPSASIII